MIEKNDPRLTDFVLGELNEADHAEIQDAISKSSELGRATDEIRQTVELLGAAYQSEEPLSLLDEQKAQLAQARVTDSRVELKRPASGRPWLPIVLAASLLGILVGGAVYMQNPRVDQAVADRIEELEEMDKSQPDLLKTKTEINDQLEKLVVEYNQSIDDGKFGDAERFAKKAAEIAPESEIAIVMNEKEKLVARFSRMEKVQGANESGFWEKMDGTDGAGIPLAMQEDSREEMGKSQLDRLKAKIESAPALEKRVSDFNQSDDEEQDRDLEQFAKKRADTAPGSEIDREINEKRNSDSWRSKMKAGQKAQGSELSEPRAIPPMADEVKRAASSFSAPLIKQDQSRMNSKSSDSPIEPSSGEKSRAIDLAAKDGFREGAPGGPGQSDDISSFDHQIQSELGRGLSGDGEPMPGQGLAGNRNMSRSGGMGGYGFGGGRGGSGEGQHDPISGDFAIEREEEMLVEAQDSILAVDAYGGRASQLRVAGEVIELGVEAGLADLDAKLSELPADEMLRKGQVRESSEQLLASEENRNLSTGRQTAETPQARPLAPPATDLADSTKSGKELAAKTPAGRLGEDAVDAVMPASVSESKQRSGSQAITAAESDKFAELEDRIVDGKQVENELKQIVPMQRKLEELGLNFGTRMESQNKTQNNPIQRTRTDEQTREVKLADGSTVVQKFQVEVPLGEQDALNYAGDVRRRYLYIAPEESERLVEKLAAQFDPNLKREFGLEELFIKPKVDELALPDDDKKLLAGIKLLTELEAEGKNRELDSAGLFRQLNESVQKRNAEVRKTRTWKRVKANPNTTRLMVGDKDELDQTGMQVNVQVDGFRARVLIDCFYYNDRATQLEGNFKLRLPDDASLYYFAFGESAYDLQPKGQLAAEEFLDDGTQFVSLGASEVREARKNVWENVKEARMVPREQAAHAYRETVRRKVDPALVEWAGAGVFNARVFPLAPHKLHRIVIGYDVNLTKADGNWVYDLDLPEQAGQCRVDLNVQPIDGVEYAIEPKSDPFENVLNGKTQRRYTFQGPQEGGIRLVATQVPELLLYSDDETEGEFWNVQFTPDLPVEKLAGNPRAIFMVDTSLSSNPDKFNVWLKLLESTLETNRDSLKQFNVLFFNVDAHFWQEKWVDNTQENVVKLIEKCNTLALEGATDLYGAIEKITRSDWVSDSPDLFLLSDGAANWGETNLRLLARQMQDHQMGSLFAYQTGLTGTAISNLRFLTGQSGGAVFSVATEDEIKTASSAHRKRPWKLNSIAADGATDIMTAGRVQWVYPGQSITIVGRGDVTEKIKLVLEQAGQTKTVTVSPERVESELASRLYGQVAVGQLESLGAKVFDVAASYARHFRVTGETCSLLMLETEADYQRFNIEPQEDLFVIKTKAAKSLVADTLKKSASDLADPKAQLLSWLERLESMPGMSFKMPTALKLAMDDIQVVAVSQPLDCSLTTTEGLSKEYLAAIQRDRLDYELIASEAKRRSGTSVDEAIKVFSSLVERNSGDLVIARDVAFTALEMGRPAQAYHLLRNVAQARPFEGSIYPALGQCLTQLKQPDMAIVYYEIALEGTFNRTGEDFKKIVSAEYMHLLRQIVAGDLESSVNEFAKARLETLKKNLEFESADLLITMMWNTDQTDVDLHILEPSGEECSYENKATRSGGKITSDITTGFGPEMYSNSDAPEGKYDIKVKYFASDQNRTELRNKVHLTIYRGFGTSRERVTRKTIQLQKVGEKESVAAVGVEK